MSSQTILSLFLAVGGFVLAATDTRFDASSCGKTKGCLFAPTGCTPGINCQVQFSYQVVGKDLAMELAGRPPSSKDGYVAIGFSKDPAMGEDMVVYCATFNGQVKGGLAWNSKFRSNTIMSNEGVQDVLSVSSADDSLYCAINQRLDPKIDKLYNLNQPHHILMAAGHTEGTNLRYHRRNRYIMPLTDLTMFKKGE